MMRHGTCTTCGAATIRAARNAIQLGEYLETVLRPHREPGTRGAFSTYSTDGLWTFVCTSCGHLELHLLDPDALAFIERTWLSVPGNRPDTPPGHASAHQDQG